MLPWDLTAGPVTQRNVPGRWRADLQSAPCRQEPSMEADEGVVQAEKARGWCEHPCPEPEGASGTRAEEATCGVCDTACQSHPKKVVHRLWQLTQHLFPKVPRWPPKSAGLPHICSDPTGAGTKGGWALGSPSSHLGQLIFLFRLFAKISETPSSTQEHPDNASGGWFPWELISSVG